MEYQFDGTFRAQHWTDIPNVAEVEQDLRNAIHETAAGTVSKLTVGTVEVTTFEDWAPEYLLTGMPTAEVSVRWRIEEDGNG